MLLRLELGHFGGHLRLVQFLVLVCEVNLAFFSILGGDLAWRISHALVYEPLLEVFLDMIWVRHDVEAAVATRFKHLFVRHVVANE